MTLDVVVVVVLALRRLGCGAGAKAALHCTALHKGVVFVVFISS